MAVNTSTIAISLGGQPQMDRRLLKAATSGDSTSMQALNSQDRRVLLGTTPVGNTCLHISSIHGHEGFCTEVVTLDESLLTVENLDGETPLLSAVTSGHARVASILLRCYQTRQLSDAILKQDIDGCNALHHAIHNGHTDLAMDLIVTQPDLSKHVNMRGESPMFIAVKRNFTHVTEELLKIQDSSHAGQNQRNALHAAVKSRNQYITAKVMEMRPEMARAADTNGVTPIRLAVYFNNTEMLRVMLELDWTLGYEVNTQGNPLLVSAAYRGLVDVARELLKHCPDAPYRRTSDCATWLHSAVSNDHAEFVEFILRIPQLSKLVNMQDSGGKTALHYAVKNCNPRIVTSLLSHKGIDGTMLDNNAVSAGRELEDDVWKAKTLNWNEVIMLMSKACPQDAPPLHNIHVKAKRVLTKASRENAKSLTQTYTSSTSLVAILIATITFAAAFTLPGGYTNDSGSEGLPIMSKKFAFQAFLISDVIAMCSSFTVAFVCIIARWEDYEFLVYYISFTKKLMWFAYVATTTAFSTGLYTVLAPRVHWLAIAICVMVALLPILTKLLGEWPILRLRFRLGKTFNSDLLGIV
ncbi:ankyrin repeat-containing protein At5g02620-like [Hordeum vulgare subsp. vulgare]|uniref:PGG domain-containing protein n=1 Tax=Hordeum vulgare subsp. vulgare TaxID=112509 RepID=A0A8I6X861_HORVV|nr:ankyrin repeat-containing protein At5g02620-like [Hordeum vulgare subsp. vulgare]